MPPTTEPETPAQVGRLARTALLWSLANTVASRLGSTVVSIVMARILFPEDYGVYAVAAVALNALLSVNELGVSLAIVRWPGDPKLVAPSVNAIAVASSAAFFVIGFFLAPYVASGLGTPEATPILRVLLVAAVIDGVTSVPAGLLTRAFRQKARAAIDVANLVVSSTISITLAITGAGAWSLAIGQLVGSCFMSVTVLLATRPYPGFGYDRELWLRLLRFGIPLAAASGLVFLMLNLDNIVVGATLGTEALGIYFVAFNLSNYPVTVISLTVRRVALAAYSRIAADPHELANSFESSLRLLMSITLPGCITMGLLAGPLIDLVYGPKWAAAAAVLAPLACLSAVRILTELAYDVLVAVGLTGRLLVIQCVWTAALAPALVYGARVDGVRGVAVGHVLVAAFVATPLYVIALRKAGIRVARILRASRTPALAGALAAAVLWALSDWADSAAVLFCTALPAVAVITIVVQWRILAPAVAPFFRRRRAQT